MGVEWLLKITSWLDPVWRLVACLFIALVLTNAWLQPPDTSDIFSTPLLRTLFDQETDNLITRRGQTRRTNEGILQQVRLHNSWYYRKGLSGYWESLGGRTIRLLRVHPGRFDDPVQCTLDPQPLMPWTRFTAVSYAWGDLRRLRAITIDGVYGFVVSESAYQVLRRVRAAATVQGQNQEQYVWIDAICINQSLNTERTHQVGLMDKIYSMASSVYVYLGPCNHNGDPGLDVDVAACEKHSSEMIRSWINARHSTRWPTTTTAECWLQEVQPHHSQWWYRVWTVQETVLARHIQVLLGPHTLSWADLILLAQSRWLPGAAGDGILALDALRHSWRLRQAQDEEVHEGGGGEHKHDRGGRSRQRESRVRLKLSELLQYSTRRRATDPLDKIYGLLGMAVNPLDAVYGVAAEVLNVRVTRHIIETEESLDVFLLGNWPRAWSPKPEEMSSLWATSTSSPSSSATPWTDYPRWALQFHEPSPNASPLDLCRELTAVDPAASGPFAASVEFVKNTMMCRGIMFDSLLLTISFRDASAPHIELAAPFKLDGPSHIELAEIPERARRIDLLALEMQRLTRKLVTRASLRYSKASQLFQEPLGKTTDWNLEERRRLIGTRRLMHKLSASLGRISRASGAATETKGGQAAGGQPDATFRQYAEHCLNRPHSTFFVTREGFIGIAYGETLRVEKPADSVAVLFGASMPFVLRVRSAIAQEQNEMFSIVAGAYISCLMRGEIQGLYEYHRSFAIV